MSEFPEWYQNYLKATVGVNLVAGVVTLVATATPAGVAVAGAIGSAGTAVKTVIELVRLLTQLKYT